MALDVSAAHHSVEWPPENDRTRGCTVREPENESEGVGAFPPFAAVTMRAAATGRKAKTPQG